MTVLTVDILVFLVVRVPRLLPVAHHDPDAKNITQVDVFTSRWTESLGKRESVSHYLQGDPSAAVLNVALKNIWYERQGPDLLLTIGPISPGGPGAPVFPRSPWRTTRHHQKHIPMFKHIEKNTTMFNLGGRYFMSRLQSRATLKKQSQTMLKKKTRQSLI